MHLLLDVANPLSRTYWGLRNSFGGAAARQASQALASHQWLSRQAVQELQWRKLKQLLAHAYDNVPYYRQVLDELGARPDDIRTPDDYLSVPILTKEAIQENLSRLTAQNVKREELFENHTGGSTGQPLAIYQDPNYRRHAAAGLEWGFRMCGFAPGDKQAFLWGSDYDSKEHRGPRGRLRDWVKNVLWINVFDLTEASLLEAGKILSRWRPGFIWGYTSSVEMLAKVVQKHGLEGIRPQSVQLTAEVVTSAQREFIEQVFHCQAFNRYGCREVSLIAHECSAHTGLHILSDNNYVEFLIDGSPASADREAMIVVTNLNNYAMPLLRYQIGDTGVPSDSACSCGRGYPLMDVAKGRLVDIIISPSGKLIHGEFFTHLFYKVRGVRQFQVIQKTKHDLHVRIVTGDDFGPEALGFLKHTIHTHGDPLFRLHFEECDHIPLTPSGKYRFTISEIPLEGLEQQHGPRED